MRITKVHANMVQDLGRYLRQIGFTTRSTTLKELKTYGFETVGRVALDGQNFVNVDVYIDHYMNGTRPIWVGFTTKLVDHFAGAELLFNSGVVEINDENWASFDALDSVARREIDMSSYVAKEIYVDHAYKWFGKYFEFRSDTANAAFEFLDDIFERLPVKFSTRNNETRSAITEKEALAFVRTRQKAFRQNVREKWKRCSVTGCRFGPALRASHILPWKKYPEFREDANNGLLLIGTLDALFDEGLISFADDGAILISKDVPSKHFSQLGLDVPLRITPPLSPELKYFLRLHRKFEFRKPAVASRLAQSSDLTAKAK